MVITGVLMFETHSMIGLKKARGSSVNDFPAKVIEPSGVHSTFGVSEVALIRIGSMSMMFDLTKRNLVV